VCVKEKMREDINKRNSEIINLYDDNYAILKIAKLMKCDFSVIKRILLENNIKIKPLNFYTKGKISKNRIIKNEQEVIDMYLKADIPGTKIAKHFNCDNSVIYDILNRNNIKIKGCQHFLKGKIWNKGIKYREYFDKEKVTKIIKNISDATKKVMENESHRKRLSEIRKKGYEEGRIKKFIGEECPRYNKTYEEYFGIEKANKIKKKISIANSGENCHFYCKKGSETANWNGGSSLEPYGREFNKKLKKAIRERDGCCMVCNLGFEDLKLLKRRVHVHHINYDKKCTLLQNLISLCQNCHSKTNHNRKHWTKFFQSLLTERYNYKYSENGEIILNLNTVGGKNNGKKEN